MLRISALLVICSVIAIGTFTVDTSCAEWPMFMRDAGRTGLLRTGSSFNNIKPGYALARFQGARLEHCIATDGKSIYAPLGNKLVKYYVAEKKEVWSRQLDEKIFTAPVVGGGIVVVGLDKGKVAAIDIKSGTVKWTFEDEKAGVISMGDNVMDIFKSIKERKIPKKEAPPIDAVPALGKSRVFVLSPSRNVFALNNSDGSVLWETALGEASPTTVSLKGSAVLVSGDVIAVSCGEGAAAALNASSGKILWKYPKDMFYVGEDGAPMAADNKTLVLQDRDRQIAALDLKSGKLKWRKALFSQRYAAYICHPMIHDDKLFAGMGDSLGCFEIETGTRIWGVRVEQRTDYLTYLAAAGNQISYVDTEGSEIFGYSMEDGHQSWKWNVGSNLELPPVVLDSLLLIPDERGTVRCILSDESKATSPTGVTGRFRLVFTNFANINSPILMQLQSVTEGFLEIPPEGEITIDNVPAGTYWLYMKEFYEDGTDWETKSRITVSRDSTYSLPIRQ